LEGFHKTAFIAKRGRNLKQKKTQLTHTNALIGEDSMSKQAKTLTVTELRRVLDYTATRKHSTRNRALLMTTFLSGMRVGEVASLRYKDLIDADGSIRTEIRLSAEQTKGNLEQR
jgi:integrase/recombinase XerD